MAKTRIGEKSPRFGAKLSHTTRSKIAKSLAGRFRHKANPNYKNGGGFSRYRAALAMRFEYRQWRRDVYERDGYSCQMCLKKSNGDIQAHHIYPVRSHPDRIFDVNNGITLCERCHATLKNKELQYAAMLEEIIHHRTTP